MQRPLPHFLAAIFLHLVVLALLLLTQSAPWHSFTRQKEPLQLVFSPMPVSRSGRNSTSRYLSDRSRQVEHEQRARKASAPTRRMLPDLGGSLARNLVRGIRDGGAAEELQRLDESLPEGAETLLRSSESQFYSFYSRMYDTLAPLWHREIRRTESGRRIQPGNYVVRAELVLDRAGNVIDMEFLETSPIAAFNAAVVDSVRMARNFRNPPTALIGRDGKVRTQWSFTVEVSANAGVRFLPPTRIE